MLLSSKGNEHSNEIDDKKNKLRPYWCSVSEICVTLLEAIAFNKCLLFITSRRSGEKGASQWTQPNTA